MGESFLEACTPELFDLICGELYAYDLWNLRKCSSELKTMVERVSKWKEICMERWPLDDSHLYLSQYKDFDLKAIWKVIKPTGDTDRWFVYYKYRMRYDQRIIRNVKHLAEFDEVGNEFWKSFLGSVNDRGYLYIPQLLRIRENEEWEKYHWSLEDRSWAIYLMGAVRRKCFYSFFLPDMSFMRSSKFLYERDILLRFSTLDPQFDKLLPYRKETFNKMVKSIYEKYDGDPIKFSGITAGTRMLDIVDALKRYLCTSGSTSYCMEDTMVLRVYAGEARGMPVVLLAIVERIARYLKVECFFNGKFITFVDPTYRDKYGYLVSDGRSIRIFRRHQFVSYLSRRPDICDGQPELYLDTNRTKEPRELLKQFLMDEALRAPTTRWANEVPSSFQTVGMTYPRGRLPPFDNTTTWATMLTRQIEEKYHGFIPFVGNEVTNVDNSDFIIPNNIDEHSWFFNSIKVHPPDFLFFMKPTISKAPVLGDWFDFDTSNCVYTEDIGNFVAVPRGDDLGVVAMAKEVSNTQVVHEGHIWPDLIYLIISTAGEIYTHHVQYVERCNPGVEGIQEFIKDLPYQMGLLFENVDPKTGRFLPNKKLKNLFKKNITLPVHIFFDESLLDY
ncbi:hypothetical protein RNJ44_04510 [Nakaseomyces bracarensis]|uniref:F-box domain-containing protein n=1 Tax=Nakaseomyces bracarensis TaxID=273131 RepID=A0ABR4NV39_9SACH